MLRPYAALVALCLATGLAGHAAAQTDATPAPTPEAAAKFIDTVLGNGVAKVSKLESSSTGTVAETMFSVSTTDCKTMILMNDTYDRSRKAIEIDWRTYVAANSFYDADVTEKWGARLLARATDEMVERDDPTKVTDSRKTPYMGVMVQPGTEELKNRLIRAMEFYGKSCAPKLDGPF